MRKIMLNRFGFLRLGRTFLLIWLGQLVSLVGTSMMRFAYILWAYEITGQATTVAMLGFAAFVLDILPYVFSIITLLLVVVPHPVPQHHHSEEGFWKQLSFGFRYIARQRGLRLLLGYFLLVNFAAYLTWFSILAPLVLARTNAD